MPGLLQVQEYDVITCNEDYQNSPSFKYLDTRYFDELDHFIREYTSDEDHADALEFMKVGFRRNVGNVISFNNYVGIIELPSGFQIEILPKIALSEQDPDFKLTKRIFLNMLCCLKEFEGKSFGNAALNADRMNLYEVFINMFIQETRKLVKHGIKSGYIQKEENLNYFKGKLSLNEHIRANLTHKERFYMIFDEYHVNRAENKLVKATLRKLQKLSKSFENVREIRQLLNVFEQVDASVHYESDFSKVSITRETKGYELLIQWAKVFLINKSFTTFSGKHAGKALLFPMEKVFEAFVARKLKAVFEKESDCALSVSVQDAKYYLFDEPRKFQLRPDIVVKNNLSNLPVVLDTKWKKLSCDARANYGISQSDMYQLYAYAKKYNTSEVWLLYPWHPEIKCLNEISFKANKNEAPRINLRVFFVDLEHYNESIEKLYTLSIL